MFSQTSASLKLFAGLLCKERYLIHPFMFCAIINLICPNRLASCWPSSELWHPQREKNICDLCFCQKLNMLSKIGATTNFYTVRTRSVSWLGRLFICTESRLRAVFALKSVEWTRTNMVCERRILKPVVLWVPVMSEKRDCKDFIQHFGLPVTVWQFTSSTPSPNMICRFQNPLKRSQTCFSVWRCRQWPIPRQRSCNCKAVCVRFMTFM